MQANNFVAFRAHARVNQHHSPPAPSFSNKTVAYKGLEHKPTKLLLIKSFGDATRLVKTTLLLCLLAASHLPNSAFAADDSPISSTRISTDNSPAAIAAAKERGAATAAKDLKAGTLRILYFGKPWSVGKPLVDDATGYRVQILAGCVVTQPFTAEVEAYNSAVRAFHAKNPSTTTPK